MIRQSRSCAHIWLPCLRVWPPSSGLLTLLRQAQRLLHTTHLILVSHCHCSFASLLALFPFAAVMDDPYNTGHGQGSGYAAGLGINTNTFNPMNTFEQYSHCVGQNHLSPIAGSRHDSVNSHTSPHNQHLPDGLYQAEPQPCGQQSTPRNNTAYAVQSATMSRNTSHASNHSSISSGQPYGNSPHFVPHNSFPNIYSPLSAAMQRSRSAYSDISTLYNYRPSPQPAVAQSFRVPMDQYSPDASNNHAMSFPSATSYDPVSATVNYAVLDYSLTGVNGMESVEAEVLDIGPLE